MPNLARNQRRGGITRQNAKSARQLLIPRYLARPGRYRRVVGGRAEAVISPALAVIGVWLGGGRYRRVVGGRAGAEEEGD